MSSDKANIPTWDGDPALWETFEKECDWYRRSLKQDDRRTAASRVWQALTGPAKRVVQRLKPDQFDNDQGLD